MTFKPIELPEGYDPTAEPPRAAKPMSPGAAQAAIELDELREAALAAQERHRRREAEEQRLEKERAAEAAACLLASLQAIADAGAPVRLAPSCGLEVAEKKNAAE